MKEPRGIFFWWLTELATYNFIVKHVPGKETGAADGLSRSDHLHPSPTQAEVDEEEEYIAAMGYVGETPETERVDLNKVTIKKAQEKDLVLREVCK